MTDLNALEPLNLRLHSASHRKPLPRRKFKKRTDYTLTDPGTSVVETNFDLTLLRETSTSGKTI
jgi:hypothetical protein